MKGIPSEEYESWDGLISDYRKNYPSQKQWVFRGQEDSNWPLQTTLERQLKKYKIPLVKAPGYEQQMIREFLRKIRNYQANYVPNDALECLSFIQHYGGTTRLLDWTYSFYVAAFFALAYAKPGTKAAIWCFRTSAWDEVKSKQNFFGAEGEKAIKEDPTFKTPGTQKLFGIPKISTDGRPEKQKTKNVKACVFQLSPRLMNFRIDRQQGVFLAPTRLAYRFHTNVQAMLKHSHFKGSVKKLVIHCSRNLLREALTDLRRMNVTYEALFGSVEYFCKSIALGIGDGRYELLTDTSGIKLLETART